MHICQEEINAALIIFTPLVIAVRFVILWIKTRAHKGDRNG